MKKEDFNRLYQHEWKPSKDFNPLIHEFKKYNKEIDLIWGTSRQSEYHEIRNNFKEWMSINGYTRSDLDLVRSWGHDR